MPHLFALLFVLFILAVPGLSALFLLYLHRRQINRFFMPSSSVIETTPL